MDSHIVESFKLLYHFLAEDLFRDDESGPRMQGSEERTVGVSMFAGNSMSYREGLSHVE